MAAMVSPGSGEPNGAFPTTHWSVVLAAGMPGHLRRRQRWPSSAAPIGTPVRVCAAIRPDTADAQDLTQGFFVTSCKARSWPGPRPARAGSDRICWDASRTTSPLIMRDLPRRNGAVDALRSHWILKTRGAVRSRAGDRHSPETLYEKNWAMAVIDQAFGLLEAELRLSGRAPLFEALCRSCKATPPGLRMPRSPGTWGPPKAPSRSPSIACGGATGTVAGRGGAHGGQPDRGRGRTAAPHAGLAALRTRRFENPLNTPKTQREGELTSVSRLPSSESVNLERGCTDGEGVGIYQREDADSR